MKTALFVLALVVAIAWTFRSLYVLAPLSLLATASICLSRRKVSASARPAMRVEKHQKKIGSKTLTAEAPNRGAARTRPQSFRSHKVTCNELIRKAAGDQAQLYLSLLPLDLRALVDRLVHSLAWHWIGQPIKVSIPATMTATSWCASEYAPIEGGEELLLVKFDPRNLQRPPKPLRECHLVDLSKQHDASRSTRLKRHASLFKTPTGELYLTQESHRFFRISAYKGLTIAQFHNTDGDWLRLGTHLCSLANPMRQLPFPPGVPEAKRAHCQVYGAEGDERLLTSSRWYARGHRSERARMYNLITGEPISEAGNWELWREGGVAYRRQLDCIALYDATTGAHLTNVPDSKVTQILQTPHWLVFFKRSDDRIPTASCWRPATPDRLYEIEFGEWELYSYGPVTWFTRHRDQHESDQNLRLVNGAVIVYDPFGNAPLYIVPLLHDPLESDEQRAQRTPPPQLRGEEAPYVPARQLMVGQDLQVVVPKGSDTHPPLLVEARGVTVYRIV